MAYLLKSYELAQIVFVRDDLSNKLALPKPCIITVELQWLKQAWDTEN